MPFGAALHRKGDVERLGVEGVVGDVADGADLFQVLVGEDRLAHFQRLRSDRPLRSKRFGRGPMNDTRLMTISSRIGSIGGFVTCAKFCLK
jgi:hypothetical protein